MNSHFLAFPLTCLWGTWKVWIWQYEIWNTSVSSLEKKINASKCNMQYVMESPPITIIPVSHHVKRQPHTHGYMITLWPHTHGHNHHDDPPTSHECRDAWKNRKDMQQQGKHDMQAINHTQMKPKVIEMEQEACKNNLPWLFTFWVYYLHLSI